MEQLEANQRDAFRALREALTREQSTALFAWNPDADPFDPEGAVPNAHPEPPAGPVADGEKDPARWP